MKPANKKVWLAAHLYYNGDLNDFIVRAITPFVNQVVQSKKIKNYFFIRYWERGQHIRLRLKGDSLTLEDEIKPLLISFFQNYYAKHPSTRENIEWENTLPVNEKLFPNDSIQFIEYEPEIDRYGGDKAIKLAELQFRASTDVVLKKMSTASKFDYATSLGLAIKLHLVFAKAMNLSIAEMKLFFSAISYHWFERAYPINIEHLSPQQKEELKKTIVDAFKNTFEKSKTALVNLHDVILKIDSDHVSFSEKELNKWHKTNKKTAQSLSKIKIIHDPSGYHTYYQNILGITSEQSALWMILESYVHMTNNRLGILNRDEAYLGYLIKESLKNLHFNR